MKIFQPLAVLVVFILFVGCMAPSGGTTQPVEEHANKTAPSTAGQANETQTKKCQNTCLQAGAKNCSAGGVVACGDHNGDSCLEWGTPAACKSNEVCDAGACIQKCQNACPQAGAKNCSGDATMACGDHNGDSCLEWGATTACKSNEVCEAGSCITDIDPHCKALFPGTNDRKGNRINVVFIGAGANSLQPTADFSFVGAFKGIVQGINTTDYETEEMNEIYSSPGLVGLEPFKSNYGRFNFWYIDEPLFGEGDLCPYMDDLPPDNSCTGANTIDDRGVSSYKVASAVDVYYFSKLKDYCDFSNSYIVIIYNRNNLIADMNFARWNVSRPGWGISQTSLTFGLRSDPDPMVFHEFVHSFTRLLDEKGSGFDSSQDEKRIAANCFSLGPEHLTPTECANRPDLPWRDLVGNGCGKDGIVDCNMTKGFFMNSSGEWSTYRFDEWIYEVRDDEGGCLEGCANTQKNIYRPRMACNLMSDCFGMIPGGMYGPVYRLGPINEREACRTIRGITGSASDYCTKLCLDGCPVGERCVQGDCTPIQDIK